MSFFLLRRPVLLALLIFLVALPAAAAKDEWLPISDDEKRLQEVPGNPGAPAILLYRHVDTDDVEAVEHHYYRIKVLTEEGRKYADVDIPYWKGVLWADDIKARLVRSDGTIAEFQGKIFEKVLAKHKGLNILAKTFTFPEVEVGSILEYRYKMRWDRLRYRAPEWTLDDELFTRRARFSMRPYLEGAMSLRWISYLPGGLKPPKDVGKDRVELEAENIPAFEKEDSMPPEKAVRPRIQFYYTRELDETPDQFWKREGKEWHEIAEQFMKKRKPMEQAVAQTVSPGDAPEAKLRKLYARVQQIRNLSFEELKTEKEEKREKLKDNNNVEDVWTRGYGYRTQINRLFVALARAAGFETAPVRVSERDEYFFIKNLLDWEQLNGEVAHVRVGGQEFYLDPGTVYCPFGLLPSERTGVIGIRLAEDGGSFIKTPEPEPEQGLIRRKAVLKLDAEGGLEGTLEIVYHGLEALERRVNNMDEDEAGRRKSLEEEVEASLPAGAEVTLEHATGWEGTEEPLQAAFRLAVPGMAAQTGRRMLVPLAVFHATKTHPFEHEKRRFAVYFDYPFQQEDEVTLELPEGYQVETLPQRKATSSNLGAYEMVSTNSGGQLQVRRRIRLNGYFFPLQHYSALRSFYSTVRAGDGEQAVLQVAEVGQR